MSNDVIIIPSIIQDSEYTVLQERVYNLVITSEGNYTLRFNIENNATMTIKVLVILSTGNATVNIIVNHHGSNSHSFLHGDIIALGKGNVTVGTTGFISRNAKGCSVNQKARGLTFNDAKITAKPILLIDNYDTKAYHGSFIGQVSEDDLWYLRSRGIPKIDAMKLIINGIINPFLDVCSEETKNDVLAKLGDIV